MSGRLKDASYVQLAILLPCSLLLGGIKNLKATAVVLFSVLVVLFGIERSNNMPHGCTAHYLRGRAGAAIGLRNARPLFPRSFVVGAKHGDDFLVRYLLRVPAYPTPDRTTVRIPLYWFLQQIPCKSVQREQIIMASDDMECAILIDDKGALSLFRRLPYLVP